MVMVRAALVAMTIGALAAPATAQPAACKVDLVTVPDDVRPVIEGWVSAETRCAVQLTVRVIPTDAGLYVLATDPSGRTRERVAPDAQTAAVLLASWVADDGAVVPAPAEPAPEPATPPALIDPFADDPTVTTAAVAAPRRVAMPRAQELSIGVVGNKYEGSGVRIDMDVMRVLRRDSAATGRTAGLMLGVTATGFWVDASGSTSSVDGTDARFLAQLTAHARAPFNHKRLPGLGGELRMTFAAGVAVTRVQARDSMGGDTRVEALRALTPCAEATLTYTGWFWGWGVREGAVLSLQPSLAGDSVSWSRGAGWQAYAAVVRGW